MNEISKEIEKVNKRLLLLTKRRREACVDVKSAIYRGFTDRINEELWRLHSLKQQQLTKLTINPSLLPDHLKHLAENKQADPTPVMNEQEILFGKPAPRMGCECGAHHTSFPDQHHHYCPQYKG